MRARLGCFPVLVLALSFSCAPLEEEEGHNAIQQQLFTANQRRGLDLPSKAITLTFDDGPASRTLELAQYLHAEGIRATFFVVGYQAANRLPVLNTLQQLGHLVANHTNAHPAMTNTNNPVAEVQALDTLIAPYITSGIHLFRAPYGDWSGTVASILNSAGLKKYVGSILWDVGGALTSRYSADWNCWSKGHSVASCGQGYLNEIEDRGRGIVLMHDSHSKTVDMVKWLVPRIKSRGFRFVRLDQVPNIGAAIRQEGGAPDTLLGPVECPAGYQLETVGSAGGEYCSDGVNVWGPFTQSMTSKCQAWGGGSACLTLRWAESLFLSTRGTALCPAGAQYDTLTSYCVEGQDAFGPFPQALVDECELRGGGSACVTARWNRNFLAWIQTRVHGP